MASNPRYSSPGDEHAVPEVAMDYCFRARMGRALRLRSWRSKAATPGRYWRARCFAKGGLSRTPSTRQWREYPPPGSQRAVAPRDRRRAGPR
eukprot:14453133-Alexandrium_andersonii.AAC.1